MSFINVQPCMLFLFSAMFNGVSVLATLTCSYYFSSIRNRKNKLICYLNVFMHSQSWEASCNCNR